MIVTDDKISNNDAIEAALQLDGDPDKVQAFYQDWADSYNLDTRSVEYSGPTIAAKLLKQHQTESDQLDYNCRLLDAGCGTGFVGQELKQQGYREIDGFDLSGAMAKQAIETACYQTVTADIDIMRASEHYPGNSYDAILSIGVFTLGHVPPEALQVLVTLTKPGGYLVISTRSHYYDQTNFQQIVDDLLDQRKIDLKQLIKNAPYNNDGDGHYWVFKKSALL
jgi:predicted TPR repeat methyltransferase